MGVTVGGHYPVEPAGPLAGIRVLSLAHHIAGPYCTKLLADYGADVLKVERPDGDPARRMGPFPDDVPHPERSGLFLFLNTNKRSLTLNLKTVAGRNIFLALARGADVVIESSRPGVLERLGLAYEALKQANPRLVLTSISNFGQSGPYRDYHLSEIVLYAMGGEMYSTGLEGREPMKLYGTVSLFQVGAVAAVATLGALAWGRESGQGQHVDVSAMDVLMGTIDRRMSTLIAYQYGGEVSQRQPWVSGGYPTGVYPCADGYFEIRGGAVHLPRVVRMLGSPDLLLHPRWYAPDAQTNPEMKAEFDAFFLGWTMQRTRQEVCRIGQEARVLCTPVNDVGELLADQHFRDRGAFMDIDHPVAGRHTYPGRPFIMRATPWRLRMPAPTLGQHNAEALAELGFSPQERVRLRQLEAI